MILLQISEPAAFSAASSIPVILRKPSTPDSTIALAVDIEGMGVTIAGVTDDAGGQRWWRQVNDTRAHGGRLLCWVRGQGAPASATRIEAATANLVSVTGRALALEALRCRPGDLVQRLVGLMAPWVRK